MYMVYSFSAPPCHYISLSDTDTDDYLDPQLTTLLHEKVVRVKKEINWDEEEKHHQERVRQKQALCYNSSDNSDSDDDDSDAQLAALLHEKVVQVKKEINWDEEERQYQQRVRQKQALCRDDSDDEDGKDLEPPHEKRVKLKKINLKQDEKHQERVRQKETHLYSSSNDNPKAVSVRTSPHPHSTPVSLSPAWISDFCDPQSGYESGQNQNKIEASSEDSEETVTSFPASPPTHEPVCLENETKQELQVMLVTSPLSTQTLSQHCYHLHEQVICPESPACTCHQPCHCLCNSQPQPPWVPSPCSYHPCVQCSGAVSSCCYVPSCNISLVKNSKRLLELDDCDVSTVANGPQPKRHCSIVQVQGCFYT